MTREDAIAILKHKVLACLRGTKWGEALEMAIKALEQEPTTKIEESNFSQDQYLADIQSAYDCGYEQAKNNLAVDCISRADALDCVNWGYNFSDIYKKINELPSITPQEPKTGHWIDKQHLLSMCSAECSECKKRASGYIVDNGFSLEYKFYDYCPNCGADMREVKE